VEKSLSGCSLHIVFPGSKSGGKQSRGLFSSHSGLGSAMLT
jgi:hypothetical protein